MRYTTRSIILPLALLLLGVAGHAAPPVPPAAKAPPPLTLARALSALPPPATGVWLAVGADKAILPAGTAPPPADASVTALANAFGDETQEFGAVTALAPASRVVLNPNPAPPDLSASVRSLTGFNLLTARLDDAQWKAVTSESGLGLPDLTDDTQRLLFRSLFPNGQIWVASRNPAQEKLPDDQRTDTRNVSDQIDAVRVRIRQTANIYLHDKQGKINFFAGLPADTTRLHLWHPRNNPSATQYNVPLRAFVPNTPKSSDLPFSDAKFQQTVTLAGAKTVGELTAQIASKTRTELYADPHYATRTLTVAGSAPEAPAGEVLRALALAVAGTYRQVGPAYVLTDDLEGVGTRHSRLASWQNGASDGMSKLKEQAGAEMLKRRLSQARLLPTFGDPLALTPEQMAGLKDIPGQPGVPGEDWNYPYAKLTPAQQAQAQKIADAYEDSPIKPDPLEELNPTGPVILSPFYAVQFLIPTVQGPVDGNNSIDVQMLYWSGHAVAEAEETGGLADTRPPAPPLLPLLHSRPRRAVFGHPTTPAAVDALVAAMQKIGLNELWLDVFSEGKSHLTDHGTDILTEALAKTKGTGIAIYADLSLLAWDSSPAKDTRDLDILGQDSRAAAIADYERKGDTKKYGDTKEYDDARRLLPSVPFVPPPMLVSPVANSVRKTLTDTMRGLASRPDLAGFVWEDAAPSKDLGYTLPMRMAFLRAFQADPVDITPDDYLSRDVSLPTFDDTAIDTALRGHWDEARRGANAFLLMQMRSAIPVSATKPILMRCNDQSPNWLASWDDPRQMAPPLRTLFKRDDFPSDEAVRAVAVKQGRTSLIVVSVKNAADTDALARDLQAALPPSASHNAVWDGYVLDFANPRVTDSAEPLRDLVRAVTAN